MSSPIRISSHSRLACNGPAPPNATSAKSRGSNPRLMVASLMALAMFASATAITAAAADTASAPSLRPIPSWITLWASSGEISIAPPNMAPGLRFPITTWASVLVGWSPPLP